MPQKMATLNISKSFVRCLFYQASYGCRCLSNIAAQKVEDAPRRKPNRKQKVVIVTEEEAAKLKKATDSQLVRQSQFDDELVNKFVNCMMWDGKKALARNIMKSTFEKIKEIQLGKREKSADPDSIEVDAFKVFHKAIENSKPYIGCQTMKKGGKNYLVPTPLPDSRRRFLAMKWMITAAREQNGPKDAKMYNKLAKELLDAYNEEGTVIRKKNELHKVAEANRAFAHFRWW